MKTTQEGIDLIKRFEGYRASTYVDPVGIPTIGYGTTNPMVAFMGNKITKEEAEQWLRDDVEDAEDIVQKHVKVPLSPEQFSALVSFAYNVGPGKKGVKDGFAVLKGGGPSSMLVKLNRRDYEGAAMEFPKWVRAGGKVLRGLVTRRNAEQALFLQGTKKPEVKQGEEKPEAILESNVEPDESSDTNTPIHKEPAVQATTAVTTAALLSEQADKVSTLAPYSTYALYAFIALTIIGLIYAIYAKKKKA
jgi:lysozyme